MMKKPFFIVAILVLVNSTNSIGQNNSGNIAQPELDSGTIENQFEYIINKSSSFKDFQLIRRTSILKVKAHALDSLKNIRKDLIETKKSIAPLKTKISSLEAEVVSLKNEIETIAQNKDSMLLFGAPINKTSYNTIVWIIIGVLTLALAFFMFQFKNNHSTAKQAKNELTRVEDELEAFKKKALKKEQEIMRKLQDEINKNSLG